LYESNFARYAQNNAAVVKNPPLLPPNAVLAEGPAMAGAVIIFHDGGLEFDKLTLLPCARIMGPLQYIKAFLKGRKFYTLNCTNDFVSVEVA
jgi:hypothetical protein